MSPRGAEGDRAVRMTGDDPLPGARPEDGWLGAAVAVVIARDGDVSRGAEGDRAVRMAGDDPLPGARPEDGKIGPGIAVVVAWHRNIKPRLAELPGGRAERRNDPLAGLEAVDGGVERAVAIVVARHRKDSPQSRHRDRRPTVPRDRPPSAHLEGEIGIRVPLQIEARECDEVGPWHDKINHITINMARSITHAHAVIFGNLDVASRDGQPFQRPEVHGCLAEDEGRFLRS